MSLLFVHGHEKIKEDRGGNFYTDGSYNQEVWDRYSSIFGKVNVIFKKDLTIYDTQYAKETFQFFDKNKINFIEIPDLNASYSAFMDLKKRRNTNNIIERAIKENDFLIARLPSSAGYTAIKYAIKHNKPYFVELVGCPWDAYWNHSFKGKMVAPITWYQTKKSVKNAKYTLYVTKEFLQQRYPSKGKTIGCSDVILPNLDKTILDKRLKKINAMKENRPVIIGTTAAVDVRYKGQEYVIKAISKLNKMGFNFEYHIVGGGNPRYLESVAEKYHVADKVFIFPRNIF